MQQIGVRCYWTMVSRPRSAACCIGTSREELEIDRKTLMTKGTKKNVQPNGADVADPADLRHDSDSGDRLSPGLATVQSALERVKQHVPDFARIDELVEAEGLRRAIGGLHFPIVQHRGLVVV